MYTSQKKNEQSGCFYKSNPSETTKSPTPGLLAQRFEIRRPQRLSKRDAAVARVQVVEGQGMIVCALGDEESVSDAVPVSMVLVVVS